jgi:protein-L-isoaspartate(D-aspartate) O-methyltransferase
MTDFLWQDGVERIRAARSAYSRLIVSSARIDCRTSVGTAIFEAFETIPREKFLGPPPWRIVSPEGRLLAHSNDPADLYQDVLVALRVEKGLNNGQPSLHALSLNYLAPQNGEHAVHVGAGTGYYTAILTALLGKAGRVDAYEIDSRLARIAAENLSRFPQVVVHARSGVEPPLPECDIIYVSAACAEPPGIWLDSLRQGGRLLFPMQTEGDTGQMLLVTKRDDDTYAAHFLCGVQFVACTGAQDRHAADALAAAFRRGNWDGVKSLRRNTEPDESCWCAGNGWWLSTR